MSLRFVALVFTLGWFACAGQPVQAASDDEDPRPPSPVPVEPLKPVAALSLAVDASGVLGPDLAFYPTERFEIGGQVGTLALLVWEAAVYSRYAVVHRSNDDVTVGVRLAGAVNILADELDAPPGLRWGRRASIEVGYEHRSGSLLLAVNLGTAAWLDGVWFPVSASALTGGVRIGHLW